MAKSKASNSTKFNEKFKAEIDLVFAVRLDSNQNKDRH